VAFGVAERRRELAMRMALGANARNVQWLVLKDGLWLAAGGVGLGTAGAGALAGTLRAMLVGLERWDTGIFSAVAGGLVAVAAIASFLPARQAAQLDPASALKP
jgi:ABC-type antimicrobial peptide transport system permease subunit